MNQFQINKNNIIQCFMAIHNPNTPIQTRKSADQYLLQCERNPIQLLPILMQIIQSNTQNQIQLQSLIYFGNVIKRTWCIRRQKQIHSAYQAIKKLIRQKILIDLYHSPRLFLFTYFDILKFICKIDYPHHFQQFTQLVIKMIQEVELTQICVEKFKQLRQIFYQLAIRKGSLAKKVFDQNLMGILEKITMLSSYFDNQIGTTIQQGANVSINLIKLSKYADQIILYILRMVNGEILDSQQALLTVKQEHTKLDHLINLHKGLYNSQQRANLQKNIKSLLYDLSSLQVSNPFMLTLVIQSYFVTLSNVIVDPKNLIKNTTLKYALLAMRKFIKEFSFYSNDQLFMSSFGSKPKSKNYLKLRNICHQAYQEILTLETVEGLLNYLIANLVSGSSKNESVSFDIEDTMLIDRSQQKQLSLQTCFMLLIQSLLQRFSQHCQSSIRNIVLTSFSNSFQNISSQYLSNIFCVLSLLPKTCKKNALYSLNQIPILDIIAFCYQNNTYKMRIPALIAGWFDYFSNQQLAQLINVLLEFIQTQKDTNMVLHCCQSLDRIIVTRKYVLNGDVIRKIFPIAINTFQNAQNPEILWPMVNLISNIIIKCEFDSTIIMQSFQNSCLQSLISSPSCMLTQALSQMLKNILCILPRHKSFPPIYQITCKFLNFHLSKLSSITSQKVLNLWYITVREYSFEQNCNVEMIALYHVICFLFQEHYKNNLMQKTPQMVYILEEYMLLGFVEQDVTEFTSIIYQFYQEAQDMDKNQSQQLKISALSFLITLITKYNLKQVHTEQMLKAIIKDFYCLDVQKISATVHNSLLSIINRFIILHRQDFFQFLSLLGVNLVQFYQVYLSNMQYLTSQSSKKLNTLSLLLLCPSFPTDLLISNIHSILTLIIPSIESYISTVQYDKNMNSYTGKVINSPTLRFASNFLSQRKQQIRKTTIFQNVNLPNLFNQQIKAVCQVIGTDIITIAQNFKEKMWADRFCKLIN